MRLLLTAYCLLLSRGCQFFFQQLPLVKLGILTADAWQMLLPASIVTMLVAVFDVPRPRASAEHPTAKPVELIRRMLANSSREGEVVLDPFCGSGSTLVACELLGRRGYGMDIDPRYCDVAIDRWEAYTGSRARRIAGSSS